LIEGAEKETTEMKMKTKKIKSHPINRDFVLQYNRRKDNMPRCTREKITSQYILRGA